jgi:hypothetical protein
MKYGMGIHILAGKKLNIVAGLKLLIVSQPYQYDLPIKKYRNNN